MASILIVEDEKPINNLIVKNLQLVGHNCSSVFDGKEAIDILKNECYDLIILDIMLPKIDGFEVFQFVKDIPTIFLTAKDSLSDKLKGLTIGADDYIIKPFEMLELIARVNIVLRRTKKESTFFSIDSMKVDFKSRQVFLDNFIVECTPKEYDLLEVLIKNRNIALSREKLLELAWGYDYEGDTRTVDVHIQKIRKKLNLEERIKTVYKLGYRLEVKN